MAMTTLPAAERKTLRTPSADVGRILLGGLVAAGAGALIAGLAFQSLVVALAAGLGGAIAGMLGPVRACEGEVAETWDT